MKTVFREIPISDISIPADRTRELNQDWVEALAESISHQGLLSPIAVRPIADDKFELIAGLHRLSAVALLNEDSSHHQPIAAHVREYGDDQTDFILLDEITENVIRNELTALDRAHSLFELDGIYKRLYPARQQGGDRKSEDRANQTAIVAVWSELMGKVGLSERAFRRATAIWKGLSPFSKTLIPGTWLADHQAGLMTLADQRNGKQRDILELLFGDEPKASSVAEALIMVTGQRLVPASEKRLASVQNNMVRMNKGERTAIFQAFEDEIKTFAKSRGWL